MADAKDKTLVKYIVEECKASQKSGKKVPKQIKVIATVNFVNSESAH